MGCLIACLLGTILLLTFLAEPNTVVQARAAAARAAAAAVSISTTTLPHGAVCAGDGAESRAVATAAAAEAAAVIATGPPELQAVPVFADAVVAAAAAAAAAIPRTAGAAAVARGRAAEAGFKILTFLVVNFALLTLLAGVLLLLGSSPVVELSMVVAISPLVVAAVSCRPVWFLVLSCRCRLAAGW